MAVPMSNIPCLINCETSMCMMNVLSKGIAEDIMLETMLTQAMSTSRIACTRNAKNLHMNTHSYVILFTCEP